MIIAGTGHRPPKLGGYSNEVFAKLSNLAVEYLNTTKPDKVISGMALGWDIALASASLQVCIPYIAAIPFEGQESRWPNKSQKLWRSLVDEASEVVIVSDEPYSPHLMQVRNEWMVDHCDKLVALYDGTSSGTANCIKYAKEVGKPWDNLWDEWNRE